MSSIIVFPSKTQASMAYLSADFSGILGEGEAVVAGTTQISIDTGYDPVPSDMLWGEPTLAQDEIFQTIHAGIAGNVYQLAFNATTNLGNQLTIIGRVAVISNDPF